jgi:hypothetical protein
VSAAAEPSGATRRSIFWIWGGGQTRRCRVARSRQVARFGSSSQDRHIGPFRRKFIRCAQPNHNSDSRTPTGRARYALPALHSLVEWSAVSTSDSADAKGASSRRSMLKKSAVAGGLVWSIPVIESITAPAAAQGSLETQVTTPLEKVTNGLAEIPPSETCVKGSQSNVGRGSVTFTRTAADPDRICAAITLTTGTDITGREVRILQSANGALCADPAPAPIGSWAATPLQGPQTFCAPVVTGVTHFVVWLSVSGGGGNDDYATEGPTPVPAP